MGGGKQNKGQDIQKVERDKGVKGEGCNYKTEGERLLKPLFEEGDREQ